MAIIPRPIKPASGTVNYIPDTTILSDEVNTDFNLLYLNVNGLLDDSNIIAGANIDGAKLLNGSVTGAKLANLTITTAQLADGAVTTAKIFQNATTPAFAIANANPSLNIQDTEMTIVTLGSVTTRGGRVLLTGTIAMVYAQARNVAVTASIRIKANASTIAQFDYPIVTADLADIVFTTYPIPTPAYCFTPASGTYVFTVTGQLSAAASGAILTPSSNEGVFSVIEFA